MVFSSNIFLFLFLPLVLLVYLLAGNRARNMVLLCASLFFYAWGESLYLIVMLFSIASNYVFGLSIDNAKRQGKSGLVPLVLAVAANLGMLAFFKYANFFILNVNTVFSALQLAPIVMKPVHLPIGISFFTFQALSYILDLYWRKTEIQKNPFHFALYISLFPQLIAGPIVRYQDVASEIKTRFVTQEDFVYGIRRFILGLGKKVLIANALGRAADYIFILPPERIPLSLAWLGAISYTLQIYFDFSGYSDMAIGLGRMFGFHFLENFNYPYISRSIREFWRRWHISLSSWFRDYLYIPLGGNKGSGGRTYMNLLVVFFLCGLWHGASWNFVIWGLFHGSFLVLERIRLVQKILKALPALLQHLYVMLVVTVGWVFFRADSLSYALGYLKAMITPSTPPFFNSHIFLALNLEFYCMLILAVIGSAPLALYVARLDTWQPQLQTFLTGYKIERLLSVFSFCFLAFVLLYSIASLQGGAHNPFLYFRF